LSDIEQLEITMNYSEMIARALNGRSVNSMAKTWGLQQRTLDRYVKGESLPDYDTAMKIAVEAGVPPGEAFETLAAEARNHKAKNFKLQMGFVQNGMLPLLLTCAALADFILC
jgi:transcriptional regulator with XRE-family HTH domain